MDFSQKRFNCDNMRKKMARRSKWLGGNHWLDTASPRFLNCLKADNYNKKITINDKAIIPILWK
ncbi:MAG: hypothetical protein A2Y12_15950 [Planctomycetes bacterium GWF2_42_9]|nr:MAG: hypothetical protein A2Y12_15950 [Planctomycetes bacterium GWF2_42_9]